MFAELVVIKVRDYNSQVLVNFRLFNHSRRFVNFSLESNLAFVSLDAKFGLLRGDMSFFQSIFYRDCGTLFRIPEDFHVLLSDLALRLAARGDYHTTRS